MIDFVEGTLREKAPAYAVIQSGGLGILLLIPLSTYDALPEPGQPARLHTHLAVREDALTLYGFAAEAERELFLLLTQVTGIGPKLGLAALSGMQVQELNHAIASGDTKRLSAVPGIGKKTAERIVVELRDKVPKVGTAAPGEPADAFRTDTRLRDATLALVALGYKQAEAQKMLEKVPDHRNPDMPVDVLVRKALVG